jgi:hypothetical protein
VAKGKEQVAFVLPEGVVPSSEPQHFGVCPGLWSPGVPATVAELDPALSDADMRHLIKEHNIPLDEVKVAADYSPKKGFSQFELRQKGEGGHLPSGPPAPIVAVADAALGPYKGLSADELRTIAEKRGVENAAELKKDELLDELKRLDAPESEGEKG